MRQKRESNLRPLTQLRYTTFNVKLNTILRELNTNEVMSVLRAPSPLFSCSFVP